MLFRLGRSRHVLLARTELARDVHDVAGGKGIRRAVDDAIRRRGSAQDLELGSEISAQRHGSRTRVMFQKRKRNPTVGSKLLRWRKPEANPPFTCENMAPT
jgi:hypothetical protein